MFAYECRLTDITILFETLLELYGEFADAAGHNPSGLPDIRNVKDVLYWFFSDYTDVTLTYRIREQLDPELSLCKGSVMDSDHCRICGICTALVNTFQKLSFR